MDGEFGAGRRPRPVTLHELVHSVACSDWCRRQGVPHGAVAAVWGALCDVLAASLAAGTGVKLPALGTFWPAPAFVVLRQLRVVRGGTPNLDAPVVPLNFFSVARLAGVRRAWATPVLRLLLEAAAGHVSGHSALDVDFGVGRLVSGDGVFAFHFSDAFLARCGVVPPSRAASRAGKRGAAPPQPAPPRDPDHLELLQDAFLDADAHRSGLLPRPTCEFLLRTAGARAIADVDSIALLGLLDAASERAGRAVAYGRLLAMLAAVAQGSRAPGLRSRSATPAPSSYAPPPPAEHAPAAAPLSPQLRLVRLTDDVFASRRAVDEHNRAVAAAGAAARDAAAQRERGVTPKVGARPPAQLRPGTPAQAQAQAEACPLAARKQAEALSDRARVQRLRAQLAQEEQAAQSVRAERQRLLRAALDAQVAERAAAQLNNYGRPHAYDYA